MSPYSKKFRYNNSLLCSFPINIPKRDKTAALRRRQENSLVINLLLPSLNGFSYSIRFFYAKFMRSAKLSRIRAPVSLGYDFRGLFFGRFIWLACRQEKAIKGLHGIIFHFTFSMICWQYLHKITCNIFESLLRITVIFV